MQNNAGKTALGLDLNVGALVCYLNICLPIGLVYSIIVLVQDKDNKLPRFHAFQSLFFLAFLTVVGIALYIGFFVGIFVDAMIGLPVVSGLFGLAMLAFFLGMLIFLIISAVKAYGGQMYKIPVIGNFAEKFS
ncbi:MAG: DUF4870 domain-containing protein [Pyrinomonadaceae bacterium]